MLKILILSHRFYPEVGGIETNSEILAKAFCDYGAEVHVVTWTKYNGTNHFPFTIIRHPSLYQLMKEHRWADVVFENNPSLRLSWMNIFMRRPLVVAVNTWVDRRVTGDKSIRDKLKNLWFGRAQSVIAVSDAIRKKEWPKAVVIENPYNDSLFKALPGAERKIPFVFLGRLVSDKGADQAIRAVAALVDQSILDSNKLQLTVIGNGPEVKNLVSLRKELGLGGAVHFTGTLREKELVDCLNRHEYILIPSVWEEPYGNVVLEGMACGCIPVASNGGGMPEAVGKAGFTFKRNDLADMTNVLKWLLVEPEQQTVVRKEALQHLAQHSAAVVSEKYFDILKEAAGQ